MTQTLTFQQPLLTEQWGKNFEWLLKMLFGIDLADQRKKKEAEACCRALEKKLDLQIEIAGCQKKGRSERWKNARFMRWQQYHAAAFDLVYGKLTDGISIEQAKIFLENFHYVEYLLAKRHHIRMREWGRYHREQLCAILRDDDQFFSGVRRFHRMKRTAHHKLMDRIDAAFSAAN